MRQIAKVVGVLTVALAVQFGVPSSSAAAKKGPTGKTRHQCFSDYNDCRINCGQLIDIGDAIANCKEGCDVALVFCLPPKSIAPAGVDIVLDGQVQILEELDRLSTKLANLQTQLANVQASPPDLLPLPRPASTGPEGFCRYNPDFTKLQVQVTNQGSTASGVSTTHVEFANNPGVDMPTPALASGGSAVVEFDIPSSCFDASSNCHFTIGVDFTNAVNESDEANNNAAGICGPAFQ